jgi:asparagine synthase (glutamine-hydrolysing)
MAAVGAVLSGSGLNAEAAIERLLKAAPHRGDSTRVVTLGRCTIGVADHQGREEATVASTGDLAVAYGGTLDNPEEIAHLSSTDGGHPSTPAQAVLAGWDAIGEALPRRLRGTFACIVTNGSRVWAFRDQVGLETLFYREDADALYLASEAKQVLRGANAAREPDLDAVEAIFYGDSEEPTRCALRGVRRLVAGTLLIAGNGRVVTRPYWDPESLLETARLSSEDAAERFRHLLDQAVRRALTGQDAVSLSGGIDSPPIATFASREYVRRWGRPIPALSAVFPSFPESDESHYIELMAADLDIPLHTYEPGPQRLERLRYWVELFDSPWSTWSPEGTAERCLHAQQLGIRTLLSGEFAEQASAIRAYLVTHLLWNGRLGAAAGQLLSQKAAGLGRRHLANEVLDAFTPRRLQARRFRRRPNQLVPPWIDIRRIAERDGNAARPARKRWAAAQLPFFGADATGEADIYSHALFGIRARRPWADIDLWEFFLSLRGEMKFPDYRMKGFVRNALRGDVPDAILDRRDKTYANRWFETMALDYPALRHWLSDPSHRVTGVDYAELGEQLEQEEMSLSHYLWAKDLATVHAFLDLWS